MCLHLSCLIVCRSINSRDDNLFYDGKLSNRLSRGRIIAHRLLCSIICGGSNLPCCDPKVKTKNYTRFAMGSASISISRRLFSRL